MQVPNMLNYPHCSAQVKVIPLLFERVNGKGEGRWPLDYYKEVNYNTFDITSKTFLSIKKWAPPVLAF